MDLDFSKLDGIAPRTNGEAPREPARAEGIQIQPEQLGGHTEPPSPLKTQADYERIVGAAKKIIENDRINHEIEKGVQTSSTSRHREESQPLFASIGASGSCRTA